MLIEKRVMPLASSIGADFVEEGRRAAKWLAKKMDADPQSGLIEVLTNKATTAHILGGARMAETPAQGVVDVGCRVFGHPGLWVIDGAAIPVNLGANPSLTITALAEHAMSLIPAKRSA